MNVRSFSPNTSIPWRECLLMLGMVSLNLAATATGTEPGRNVCARQQYYTRPVHLRQSYHRPVQVRDFARCAQMEENPCNRTRTAYQQAYRTVIKLAVRARMVPGCCPGWKKRSPEDIDCLEPQCSRACENAGQCVGPETCLCPEGFAGQYCQTDIDECSGRHSCQQKCINQPGTYECACSQGFRLASDQSSCELCLPCNAEFQALEAKVDSLPLSLGRWAAEEEEKEKKEKEKKQHDQMQADMVAEIRRQDEKFDKLQSQYDSIIELRRKVDVLPQMSERLDNLTDLHAQVANVRVFEKRMTSLEERLDEGMADIKASHTELGAAVEATAQKLHESVILASQTQSAALEGLQRQLEDAVARLEAVEQEKEELRVNLTSALSQYEASFSALQKREAATTTPPVSVTPPYSSYGAAVQGGGGGGFMPLETLASLSQQISILEERMSECNCNQHYYG